MADQNILTDDQNISTDDQNISADVQQLLDQGKTQDAIQLLLKQHGYNNVQISVNKKFKVDHLIYDENQIAICSHNPEHKFDVSTLTEETRNECCRTGLCPNCLEILHKAREIKQYIRSTRHISVPRLEGVLAPAVKVRIAFEANLDKINEEIINKLSDITFCKKMSLSYLFLLDVTNCSDDEKKKLKRDSNGYLRYTKQEYDINGSKFSYCKEIYDRNVTKILNVFKQLGFEVPE